MILEAGLSASERVAYGFRLCVSRQPQPVERNRLVALYRQEKARYENDNAAARAMAGAADPGSSLAERAAWTVVANVMLNMDETLTKE
jgi:hypothetical protein